MINFDKYLKEILYDEDFIIIPGLGAFIAKFSKAEINEQGELKEPAKTFEFNGLLNQDEGNKFVNYVLRKENLPKSDIQIQLKDYLYKLKSGLSTNKKVVLADVCDLEREEDGQLIGTFHQDVDYYYKPEFQDPFVVEKEAELEEVYNPVPAQEILAEPLAGVSDDSYTSEIEYDYGEEERSTWVKYLLYILPLLLIFGALYYVVLYKPFQGTDIPTVDARQEIIEPSVEEGDGLSEEPMDIIDTARIVDEIHQGLKEQSTELRRFEVSAGLFKNKTNADKLVQRMTAEGFNAEIKLVNGMRRVFVPVNGIEEAESMSNRIEQFTGDKSVYFDENGISNR